MFASACGSTDLGIAGAAIRSDAVVSAPAELGNPAAMGLSLAADGATLGLPVVILDAGSCDFTEPLLELPGGISVAGTFI